MSEQNPRREEVRAIKEAGFKLGHEIAEKVIKAIDAFPAGGGDADDEFASKNVILTTALAKAIADLATTMVVTTGTSNARAAFDGYVDIVLSQIRAGVALLSDTAVDVAETLIAAESVQ